MTGYTRCFIINQNKINITKFFALVILTLLVIEPLSYSFASAASTESRATCKCVIFRLDDVSSEWLPTVQMYVMDEFISKNQYLSLGLIMHKINETSAVVEKIKEGKHVGLFELDLHGWDHVYYTKLGEQQQKTTLEMANDKMKSIFGAPSIVFIPPYDLFNNSTLQAASDSGIKVLSAATSSENDNRFIWNPNNSYEPYSIYQLPESADFMVEDQTGKWQEVSNSDILALVDKNITEKGYAVVLLHPQNFAKFSDGDYIDIIDINQLSKLDNLIEALKTKNISTSTFSDAIDLKIENPDSYVSTPEFNTTSLFVLITSLISSIFISRIYKKILR